ncbi:MAG: hypothetical protein UU42_C0028G0007 [Candidatus Woesebacteria bacterium GW2011_GWA1_41_13b]|uniref:Uncharacterized protein n=1 Tax=Candidatus Woesebacteria bacterium GW2011_GWA1_41_13b TaxID=1618555 RepID=A0A0G0UQ88_9BACT|nr:MAG: hypothetical protein UU42_C0028G0007 [Candidatus Woesebacteria bacterium GW2011_GWA1_41_13b]
MKQYRNLLADVGFDYGDPDLPMVFGSETEFGFAYGKVLDGSRESFSSYYQNGG